jgi:hypothetical protein
VRRFFKWLFLWPILIPLWLWNRSRVGRFIIVGLGLILLCPMASSLVGLNGAQERMAVTHPTKPPARTESVGTDSSAVKPQATAQVPKTPTPTATPSSTPTPTLTPMPATATAIAQATKAAYACLNASYVADVTVPDGTRLDAGVSFMKTWRVKNTGKCDWKQGAVIAFESGDKLGSVSTVPVGAVSTGKQVDISVPMRSPQQGGNYTSVWRMQDGTGRFFGERLSALIVASGSVSTPRPTQAQYLPLLTHLFTGVKIYYGLGANKAYGFEAIGGSESCSLMPSGRGVLVRYPDGTQEWKDRRYLIESGLYFVRADDPNATSWDWVDLPGCP